MSVVKEVSSRREFLQNELIRLTQCNQEMMEEVDTIEKKIEIANDEADLQIN